MPFIRELKNRSYFSRYQTKYRRRRECKTNYKRRRKLCTQKKSLYGTRKFRLVPRFSNKDIVVQIFYSRIIGDFCVCAAYSHELPRYGVKYGLTNYAAAYATGLLCARRQLTSLGLADKFKGVTAPDGEHFLTPNPVKTEAQARQYHIKHGKWPDVKLKYRPFVCILDIGLAPCTVGHRAFACMKGAVDGGLIIPHSDKKFVGWDGEEKSFDPSLLKKYIFGGHVADYMRKLEEEDPESYKKQFGRFVKDGIKADDLEGLYAKAHEAIRKDPKVQYSKKPANPKHYHYNKPKKTVEERRENLKKRFLEYQKMAE